MKNTLRQVFHSSKFIVGFTIMVLILGMIFIYPLFNPGDPLEMIGLGNFFKPGIYVSTYDANSANQYTLKLDNADSKRLEQKLSPEDRITMMNWLMADGVKASAIHLNNTTSLLNLWKEKYDPKTRPDGMTISDRNAARRLNVGLQSLLTQSSMALANVSKDTGTLEKNRDVATTDYVNVNDVANVKILPLGTDTFGRDVLKELVSAAKTSIGIGLIAGIIATFIGLLLGLLAGYLGGWADDVIMFITNIFTVIPGFVLLILISYSVGQDQRGATTVAVVIGLTSWVWTTRSVRSQVISLRNRDHVNLSKLSGHSIFRIITTDILPYIASYVVMALILQISSAILAEAQLSMLGLGPSTTAKATLGLMMNWAMLYSAHLNGSWWAYFPVILTIALISFSLNLMNTGLDQVFNPTLRD